jgi:hypothetical protein
VRSSVWSVRAEVGDGGAGAWPPPPQEPGGDVVDGEQQHRRQRRNYPGCRMDILEPTTLVGARTEYSVGPWDYSTCATRHLMAWGARTTVEEYSDRKLCMSRSM